MTLSVRLRWLADGTEIDLRLIELLHAVANRGSLTQAAREIGLSYRHAWELLGRLEALLGQRLVRLERGRGATLTAQGRQFAAAVRGIEARLNPQLQRVSGEFDRSLASVDAPNEALRVHASHDFALDRLAELLPRHGGPVVELRVQGSLEALGSLARNRCEIAGFHVPTLPGRRPLLEPFRPLLKARALRLVHFADRTQGLIVARRNPLQIGSLADLARRQARFVNRQAGSGTRLFFDALLAAHRIRPAQINGYRREEFTHAAVAAIIASGTADAAFGVEAAAAQHGLAFVPLASERYFLALRASAAARPEAQAVVHALGSRWFQAIVRALPGYVAPARSLPTTVQEAFDRFER